MIDFLTLFGHALRYSIVAITHPARDQGLRRLQYCTLACCLLGIGLMVWAIADLIVSDFGGMLWFWLLIAAGVCWMVAACTGHILDRHMKQYQPGDD